MGTKVGECVLVAEGALAIAVTKSYQGPNIGGITIDTLHGYGRKCPNPYPQTYKRGRYVH